MFWMNLVKLCNEKNTTPNAVCVALGLSCAAATKWRNGAVPRETTLLKIADHFGVSVDYLLGKTEQKEKPSPEGESPMEDVVIVHRDGKTVVRKYTKEQLDAIEAMLNQIGDSRP